MVKISAQSYFAFLYFSTICHLRSDDSAELSLRRSTVNTYVSILLSSNKPILQYPDVFIQIMSWILGEYGYLADTMTVEGILERMCELVSKKNSSAIGGSHEAK